MLILSATASASEQAILTADAGTGTESYAVLVDNTWFPIDGDFMWVPASPGVDFSGSASSAYIGLGLVGAAASHWEHAYDPSNPGLSGAFSAIYVSGWGTGASTSDGAFVGGNVGLGISALDFSVASDTPWTFTADVVGRTSASGGAESSAYYGFSLRSADWTTVFGEAINSAHNGESLSESVNIGGVIPAGDYRLVIGIEARQGYSYELGSGSASIELTNGVLMVPEPSAAALIGMGGMALLRRRRASRADYEERLTEFERAASSDAAQPDR